MGLNDPSRISSLISALPTDPDAPSTRAAKVRGMRSLPLLCDELHHAPLKHRQRIRRERQDGIVEPPLVKLRAQLRFGVAAMSRT